MLGRAYYRTYGLPVITVRPSNNYGPWQFPEKLIPVVVLKALNMTESSCVCKRREREGMAVCGRLYRAVFEMLEKGKPGDVYNVGSGEEKKNIDVVKAILEILGRPEDLIEFVKDRPGHDFRYSLDSGKYRNISAGREKHFFLKE